MFDKLLIYKYNASHIYFIIRVFKGRPHTIFFNITKSKLRSEILKHKIPTVH